MRIIVRTLLACLQRRQSGSFSFYTENYHYSNKSKLLSKMLVLSETNVRQCLDMRRCLEANRRALLVVATGDAIVPTRLSLPFEEEEEKETDVKTSEPTAADCSLFKPASMVRKRSSSSNNNNHHSLASTVLMGMKVVSLRASNPERGFPLVPASVLHMNPVTGIVDAFLAGTHLTAARTAAGSALAIQHYFAQIVAGSNRKPGQKESTHKKSLTDLLQHVVIFGAGLQAEQHVHAIREILRMDNSKNDSIAIPHVTLINRTVERAESLSAGLLGEGLVRECRVVALPDTVAVRFACRNANVIVTCTNTPTPLWEDDNDDNELDSFIPNSYCIIAGIGSYTPQMQEVPSSTVNQCQQIWIDTPEALLVGDLQHLAKETYETKDETQCRRPQLIGNVLLHQKDSSSDMLVNNNYTGLCFYKAVGTAIQDVVTADIVVEQAKLLGIGTIVDMS